MVTGILIGVLIVWNLVLTKAINTLMCEHNGFVMATKEMVDTLVESHNKMTTLIGLMKLRDSIRNNPYSEIGN